MKTMTLDCHDVKQRMQLAPETQLIVDVGDPREFRSVRIPGSRNVPMAELDVRIDELKQAASGRRLVLVSRSGHRAVDACAKLAAAGLKNAGALEGGVENWVLAGGAVRMRSASWTRAIPAVAVGLAAVLLALAFV